MLESEAEVLETIIDDKDEIISDLELALEIADCSLVLEACCRD